MSLVLFACLHASIRRGAAKVGTVAPRFWPAYRVFLGLFWMTAPLALVYAVPYERFLSPAGAVRANLWTLGLVALWRVLLITRVISVLTGRGFMPMLMAVMLVGDVVLLVALFATPTPVLDMMGGIRLTEREQVLRGTTFLATFFGVCSLPVWLFGGLGALASGETKWDVRPTSPAKRPRGLVWLAAASVIAWAPVLPFTQREQRLRRSVERDLKSGRVVEAVATMSAHAPGDFPPHWDPPPRPAYREDGPPLLDVLETIGDRGAADWVRAVYVAKLEQGYLHSRVWMRLPPGEDGVAEWARVERVVDRLPEGPALRREHRESIDFVKQYVVARNEDPTTRRAATLPTTLPTTTPAGGAR